MIRNEADILEAFVRYHLQIVDHMIIINHRSVDASGQILHGLLNEGLPIDVLNETSHEQQQARLLTRMMKTALDVHHADWILPLDADEFVSVNKRGYVRDTIAQLPNNVITKMPWRTYVPLPSDDPNEFNVIKRIRNRVEAEPLQWCKIVIPRFLAEKKNSMVSAGNHGFMRRVRGRWKEHPSQVSEQLVVAHFPVRSAQQITTKAFAAWPAILAKPNKEPTEGFHLKLLFDRFIKNDRIQPEELASLAFHYVLGSPTIVNEPLRPDRENIQLRFSASYTADPLPILAQTAEDLAEALAAARRNEKGKGPLLGKIRQWFRARRVE